MAWDFFCPFRYSAYPLSPLCFVICEKIPVILHLNVDTDEIYSRIVPTAVILL